MDERDRAIALMERGQFQDALPILEGCLREDPHDAGVAYMAGQCCRFTGDLDRAAPLLARAAELAPGQPEMLLALGIVHQLRSEFTDAATVLEKAIQVNPDYVLAFNSLGLTRKQAGDLLGALEAYESGGRALARQVAAGMRNQRENQILKHRNTPGQVWTELAIHGALLIAAQDPRVAKAVFPTGAQAEEEERTERHAGLYWTLLEGSEPVLYFLPNYFNTFREALRHDQTYANLVGNIGTTLEALGRVQEAREHYAEAEYFS